MEDHAEIDIDLQTQKTWNEEQREELVKCLAVNLFWVVPALTFWTYLIAYLSV